MKNLILTLMSMLSVYTLCSQESLLDYWITKEVESFENIVNSDKLESNNKNEYREIITSIESGRITKKLQNDIGNYNIKSSLVFDNSEAATYKVSFKRKNAKASVTFDNNGEIINSEEVYHNINLPNALRIKIVKTHPNFGISNCKVSFSYNRNSEMEVYYKVWVQKGNRKKVVKFNKDFEII